MLTAMLAAKNLLGERHDVWNVNVERSYHEEFVTDTANDATSGQRAAVPAEAMHGAEHPAGSEQRASPDQSDRPEHAERPERPERAQV